MKKQNGFSTVEILLVATTLAVVCFAGWLVVGRDVNNETTANKTISEVQVSKDSTQETTGTAAEASIAEYESGVAIDEAPVETEPQQQTSEENETAIPEKKETVLTIKTIYQEDISDVYDVTITGYEDKDGTYIEDTEDTAQAIEFTITNGTNAAITYYASDFVLETEGGHTVRAFDFGDASKQIYRVGVDAGASESVKLTFLTQLHPSTLRWLPD